MAENIARIYAAGAVIHGALLFKKDKNNNKTNMEQSEQ